MVMRGLGRDLHLDGIAGAFAGQCAAGKVLLAGFNATIHRGMNRNIRHIRVLSTVCTRGEQACFSRQECLDGSGAMEIPEAAILRSDLNPSVGADYCTVSGKLRAWRYGREKMALRRRKSPYPML
jgi:hypothetical protein